MAKGRELFRKTFHLRCLTGFWIRLWWFQCFPSFSAPIICDLAATIGMLKMVALENSQGIMMNFQEDNHSWVIFTKQYYGSGTINSTEKGLFYKYFSGNISRFPGIFIFRTSLGSCSWCQDVLGWFLLIMCKDHALTRSTNLINWSHPTLCFWLKR